MANRLEGADPHYAAYLEMEADKGSWDKSKEGGRVTGFGDKYLDLYTRLCQDDAQTTDSGSFQRLEGMNITTAASAAREQVAPEAKREYSTVISLIEDHLERIARHIEEWKQEGGEGELDLKGARLISSGIDIVTSWGLQKHVRAVREVLMRCADEYFGVSHEVREQAEGELLGRVEKFRSAHKGRDFVRQKTRDTKSIPTFFRDLEIAFRLPPKIDKSRPLHADLLEIVLRKKSEEEE